jgi:hypothetical protein
MLRRAEHIYASEVVVDPHDHERMCAFGVADCDLYFLPTETYHFHHDILRPARQNCTAESGAAYNEPPCGQGEKCVCLLSALGGPGGLVCRAKPHTMLDFVEERRTGTILCEGEPCLLCKRWNDSLLVAEAVQTRRGDEPPVLLQDHRVSTEAGDPESYHVQNCFDPAEYASFGLYAPIVSFHLHDYAWVQDAKTGTWFIDQSKLTFPRRCVE